MKLAVLLQASGLAGLAVGSFLVWGVGVAVLVGSSGAVLAGTLLEREHT